MDPKPEEQVPRALAALREDGVAVIEGVLGPAEALHARAALLAAAAESERRGLGERPRPPGTPP
jgi:hypothetical protein